MPPFTLWCVDDDNDSFVSLTSDSSFSFHCLSKSTQSLWTLDLSFDALAAKLNTDCFAGTVEEYIPMLQKALGRTGKHKPTFTYTESSLTVEIVLSRSKYFTVVHTFVLEKTVLPSSLMGLLISQLPAIPGPVVYIPPPPSVAKPSPPPIVSPYIICPSFGVYFASTTVRKGFTFGGKSRR